VRAASLPNGTGGDVLRGQPTVRLTTFPPFFPRRTLADCIFVIAWTRSERSRRPPTRPFFARAYDANCPTSGPDLFHSREGQRAFTSSPRSRRQRPGVRRLAGSRARGWRPGCWSIAASRPARNQATALSATNRHLVVSLPAAASKLISPLCASHHLAGDLRAEAGAPCRSLLEAPNMLGRSLRAIRPPVAHTDQVSCGRA